MSSSIVSATTTEEKLAKHTVKDSVFSDLFKKKKYLLQLYQTLHPEDLEATEEDIKNITIKNVLINDLYNDLGFQMREQLIILVEAQSTWSVNIIIRALLYLAYTYKEYLHRTDQSLYESPRVKLPRPELYVVYTGEEKEKPETIRLSEEFFAGEEADLEIRVRVIHKIGKDDILSQYISFCRIYNDNRKKYGRSRLAIKETIRICKDKNVLKEYLESRENEVISMTMPLFDEEEIRRDYERSLRRRIREELREEVKEEVKEEIKEKVKEEIREKVKEEIKEEVKEEIKEEVKEEIREEVREEAAKETEEAAKKAAKEAEEASKEAAKRMAVRMIKFGKMSLEEIAVCTELPINEVKKLKEAKEEEDS